MRKRMTEGDYKTIMAITKIIGLFHVRMKQAEALPESEKIAAIAKVVDESLDSVDNLVASLAP